MSVFNPDNFLNQTVEGEMATVRTPVDEGEYPMVIDDSEKGVQLRSVEIKKGANAGKTTLACDITMIILDEALKAKLNRDKVTSRLSFFVDLTPDGKIATGEDKNLKLGRLREALGQNVPGQPWSFAMLRGSGPVLGKIKHRPDENDEKIVYDEVVAVTAMK